MTMARNLAVWLVCLTVAGLMMVMALAGAARAQEAVGAWHGAVAAPGIGEMRMGVEISDAPGGGLRGVFLSPDQGDTTYPLADIKMANGTIAFAVPTVHGDYEGQWDSAKSLWRGRWTQPGGAVGLTLEKGKAPVRIRPQTPKPPFPYRAEEVSIDAAPGVRLAGTLTFPAGKGPFPAAVLITGSGREDRDETIMGHKPFLVLADALTRRGIAVLRLDDRGAGGSTGDYAQATLADFVSDVQADVRFLRARRDIDPARIGLIGHSEGGIVGPIVAGRDPKIAFVVMMAGPGVPLRDIMSAQRAAINKASGVPAAAVAMNEAIIQRAETAMAGAKDAADASARIHAAFADYTPRLPSPVVDQIASQLGSNEIRTMLTVDPRPSLGALRMPVLALDGSKDLQVLADQNVPALREALKANPRATVVELPSLNHLFQTATTGAPTEYAQIEETLSPAALQLIADWVVRHTAKGAAT
jgi:pimeloyl-ACP methyl ester carboxylesterase